MPVISCYNFNHWPFALNSKYPKLFKNLVNDILLSKLDFYSDDCFNDWEVMDGVPWVEHLTFKEQGFLLKKLYIGMNAPYVDDNTSELTEDFYMESFLQTLIKDALILYYAFANEGDDNAWGKVCKQWNKVLASGLGMTQKEINAMILDEDFDWLEELFWDNDFVLWDTTGNEHKKYRKSLFDYENVVING